VFTGFRIYSGSPSSGSDHVHPLMLAVYRIGAHIPTPGYVARLSASIFIRPHRSDGFFRHVLRGGSFQGYDLCPGIMPYITASIVLQLLTVVGPAGSRRWQEGEAGRKKITVHALRHGLIAAFQSFWMAVGIERMGKGPLWIPQAGPSDHGP